MRRLPWVMILLCVTLSAAVGFAADKGKPPTVSKGWKFTLPAGDAAAGKEAFRTLQCYDCHKTSSGDFPAPRTSGGTGPDLGPAFGRLPREYLAEAIINPHKYISGTLEHYRGVEKVSTEMRDYNSFISVRQLLDLVEFIKSLDTSAAAKP